MTDTIKARLIGTANGRDLHQGDMGSVYATRAGEKDILGGAWGPSANGDGNWFCYLAGQDPIRVESYDAAIDHITGGGL